MANITPEEALRYYKEEGSIRKAAKAAGVPRTTFRRYLNKARIKYGEFGSGMRLQSLQKQVSDLKTELKYAKSHRLTTKEVKAYILKLNTDVSNVKPNWLYDDVESYNFISGVPSLMLSDFHWSEVVDPDQVFDKNIYNLEVASERLHIVVRNSINILKYGLTGGKYKGIIVNLAGDMISGDIHDELSITNDRPIMPTFLNLYSEMISVITKYIEEFGRVFVPCVHGNHTRTTKKIPAKDRAYTNFDWLLYNMLAKYFEDDNRVDFLIADGGDIQYKVYDHVYRLTHGDQFRGGTGFLGAAAPIIRDEQKKRSASTSYNYSYDTLLLGHFHQYMTLSKAIVNGSLVGYNEYALLNNFPYELPRQALWVTNPTYGITVQAPVVASDIQSDKPTTEWVSVPIN